MRVWREIFLDIALRAMRRIHFEYGSWELGQDKLTLKEFTNLNQGDGINYAAEETVRDAISQEVILSGLWKKHPILGEKRSWWIDREVRIPYKVGEAKKTEFHKPFFKADDIKDEVVKHFDIDMVFKRIEPKARDGQLTLPHLIEAKRFELITIDLKTKSLKIGNPQLNAIDDDIFKLKLLQEVYKDKKIKIKDSLYNSFRNYIFVWGTSTKKFDVKKDLINRLENKSYLLYKESSVRYLPIQWNKNLKVVKSLWLALVQIK